MALQTLYHSLLLLTSSISRFVTELGLFNRKSNNPANKYMFKVSNRNTRKKV